MFTILAIIVLFQTALERFDKHYKKIRKIYPEYSKDMCKNIAFNNAEMDVRYMKYMIAVGFIIDVILGIILL